MKSALKGTQLEDGSYIVQMKKAPINGAIVTFMVQKIIKSIDYNKFKRQSQKVKDMEAQVPTDPKIKLNKDMEDFKLEIDREKKIMSTLFEKSLRSAPRSVDLTFIQGKVIDSEYSKSEKKYNVLLKKNKNGLTKNERKAKRLAISKK